ncbi:MAG TPA: hypothetical protein VIM69_10700 [Opitutaceae bacterium]
MQVVCATIIVLCTVGGFYSLGPALETTYWPVVSKLQIEKTEWQPDGWVKLRVRFKKLRDCEYVNLAWYKGNRPDDFERVAVIVQRDPKDTGSPNRPLGTQRAGPWLVAVTEEELKYQSFAQLWHRCHPFWTTVTEFYP